MSDPPVAGDIVYGPGNCRICKEFIPKAALFPREGGGYTCMCRDCRYPVSTRLRDYSPGGRYQELAEIQYHGSRWYTGEW